jgi:hypothetical protein
MARANFSETFEPNLKLQQHEVIGCRVKLNVKKLFTEPSLTVFDRIGCFACMNDILPPPSNLYTVPVLPKR